MTLDLAGGVLVGDPDLFFWQSSLLLNDSVAHAGDARFWFDSDNGIGGSVLVPGREIHLHGVGNSSVGMPPGFVNQSLIHMHSGGGHRSLNVDGQLVNQGVIEAASPQRNNLTMGLLNQGSLFISGSTTYLGRSGRTVTNEGDIVNAIGSAGGIIT